ncbi:MAG: protein kinase, partial [Acidimicrobiia bacterium]|nr:protein kinase [Acidimicrobiia bacterium]
YLPRGSVADRLHTTGPLPTTDILAIGVQLCDALEAAHGAGVLHRDIKPENVLVDASGQCKLADFGVAAARGGTDGRDTGPGRVIGTAYHVAPEVLEGGSATIASDIYSLGSTLAELALGRPPFARPGDDTVIPIVMRVVREPLPDLRAEGVDDRLAAAIELAMAKEPGERFGSAAAFGNALQQVQQRVDLPVTPMHAERPTIPPRPPAEAPTAIAPAVAVTAPIGPDDGPDDDYVGGGDGPRRSRRLAIIVVVLALLAAAAAAGVWAVGRDDNPAPTTTSTSSTTTTATTATPPTAPLRGERYLTNTAAIAAAEAYKGLGLQVVDSNAYLGPSGLGVLVARVDDGRSYLVIFFDGHLIGLDFSEPSWSVRVVDQTPDTITVDYGLYAANQSAPAPTTGVKRITFRWDPSRARLSPENGPVPPTDRGVDQHR